MYQVDLNLEFDCKISIHLKYLKYIIWLKVVGHDFF